MRIRTEPFDRLDTLSAAELDRWWVRRLRRVLTSAAELPYYRQRFAAAGFEARRFRDLADLAAVPVFDKDDVIAAQNRAGSHRIGLERVRPEKTAQTLSLSSGTSGTSFLTHTARWRHRQGESSARGHWWAGLRPGATPFVLSAPAWHSYAAVQPYLAERFDRPCVVVSGTYLPRFADRIVDALRRFRPDFVTMFLPMVFSILAEGRRQGREGREVFDGVEVLVVTGAPITPGMRAMLQAATGVRRVAEIAGTSENVLAVDCERADGLHVVPDTCYVEILDPAERRPLGDGRRGSIVHCYTIDEGSMYLRYDSGDAGTIDRTPCSCGLPSPRIRMLGRWESSFVLAGERLLPYDVQVALEEEMPETAGAPFVIVREALAAGRLRLLLAAEDLRDGRGAAMGRKLAARFGVGAEVEAVRELPLRFKGVAPVLSEAEVERG